MEFKSYYGASIREALQTARQELGPDAAILASRQTDDGTGRYEVVCGVVPALQTMSSPDADRRGPVARRVGAAQAESFSLPNAEEVNGLSKLRRRFEGVREALRTDPKQVTEGTLDKLWLSLMTDGFGEDLTNEIMAGVRRRVRGVELAVALIDELDSRTRIDPALGRGPGKRRITALVGPPGVGKTTLLVKLAVHHGLTGRKPLRLISLDSARVGGTDMLERYASGMAVRLDTVDTGMALVQVLDTHLDAGLILIDTPGLSPSNMPAAQEYLQVLSRHPEIDIQLVVPATMSPADMKQTYDRFRPLLPSRLALTHTDTAVSCRSAIALALRHEMPLSFVGTGPAVPDDYAEASVRDLLRNEVAASKPQEKAAVTAA